MTAPQYCQREGCGHTKSYHRSTIEKDCKACECEGFVAPCPEYKEAGPGDGECLNCGRAWFNCENAMQTPPQ